MSTEEAKAVFVKADKALNEAWAAAKKALAEPDFAELQGKQRNWMARSRKKNNRSRRRP
jgi:uncharacterized protein YecT (DUF1311 family)